MKNAHKLAALIVVVVLCLASYFIFLSPSPSSDQQQQQQQQQQSTKTPTTTTSSETDDRKIHESPQAETARPFGQPAPTAETDQQLQQQQHHQSDNSSSNKLNSDKSEPAAGGELGAILASTGASNTSPATSGTLTTLTGDQDHRPQSALGANTASGQQPNDELTRQTATPAANGDSGGQQSPIEPPVNPPGQLDLPTGDTTATNDSNNNNNNRPDQQQVSPPESALGKLLQPQQQQQQQPPPLLQQPSGPPAIDTNQWELDQWRDFKLRYNRVYAANSAEELQRRTIFIDNLRFIRAFNERSQALFQLGVNHFADHTTHEINQLFVGPQKAWNETLALSAPLPPLMRILASSDNPEAVQSMDWRNLTGAPVDQGPCRESSVFAVVASLEAAVNAASTSRPGAQPAVKLSEQQVLDCLAYAMPPPPTRPPVCQGHLMMVEVLEALQRQSIRLATGPEYDDFKRRQMSGQAPANTCVPPPPPAADSGGPEADPRPKLGSYVKVHRDNIQEAVLNSGPLVVAVDASQPTFHFYKSGLYHELQCSLETYNLHALLVAYNSNTTASSIGNQQQQQQDQSASLVSTYTIRPSFGSDWGESGYMQLLKDEARNRCLPQQLAIYPNLAY